MPAAFISGVTPELLAAFTSAPASTNFFTSVVSLLFTARSKGVLPCSSLFSVAAGGTPMAVFLLDSAERLQPMYKSEISSKVADINLIIICLPFKSSTKHRLVTRVAGIYHKTIQVRKAGRYELRKIAYLTNAETL